MYRGETQPGSSLDTCVVVDGAPWANQKHPLHPKHQTSCSADPVCLPTHHVHLLRLGLSAPSTQLGRADAQESFAELTWWLLILLLRARHKFIKKRREHSLTQLPSADRQDPALDAAVPGFSCVCLLTKVSCDTALPPVASPLPRSLP